MRASSALASAGVSGWPALLRDLRAFPNLVSIARVALIYVALALFCRQHFALGVAVGVVAGLTDYLDGYLARRLGLSTRIGALLDQVADVLFLTGSVLVFVIDGTWPAILLFVILFREFVVLNLRASAAQMGFSLPSIFLGKLASNFLFYALGLVGAARGDLFPPVTKYLFWLAHFGIATGTLMSLVTAVIYARSYARKYVAIGSSGGGASPAEISHRGGDEGAHRAERDDR